MTTKGVFTGLAEPVATLIRTTDSHSKEIYP